MHFQPCVIDGYRKNSELNQTEMKQSFLLFALVMIMLGSSAQNIQNNPGSNHGNKFEQLGTVLPTPNEYRAASGAPGGKYWQQRCDYDIKCELDEPNMKLKGSEVITYYNNSPDVLTYLWLQLDENEHSTINRANYQSNSKVDSTVNDVTIEKELEARSDNGYGVKISKLQDANGKNLKHTINRTMMRVELPAPLKPGQKFIFNVEWSYKIPDLIGRGGRGGSEFFPEDGNHLFTIVQWYPRLCVYGDAYGWQNQQFAGRGEFTLSFGNFKVQMTVPADHVVGATGECQNYQQVLSPAEFARYQKASNAKEPVEIVTLEQAKAAEKKKSTQKKTWIFKADNVRDFGWTSSRKFIWDAMPAWVEGKKVMCMSFYPKEAYGLFRKYSTKVVAHTVKTYSKYTIPYPYPVAQSVEASNGMEYPMICFNYGRTAADGTYPESVKYGMLGVIIHEVGHNFFPMIINSDERQWTWMDEGLNTYVQFLTESLFDNKFPSKRGPANAIVDYMKLPKDQLEPVMTNSENIIHFGPNAYAKPATALNILRETIMGRELFDYAFKEYAKRWAFRHPTPADLFRTLEDASGEDLDWFWRGWFYSTDPCDISLDSVKYFRPDVNAAVPVPYDSTVRIDMPQLNSYEDISKIRNRDDKNVKFLTDTDTTLRDFYWEYARGFHPFDTTSFNIKVDPKVEALDAEQKAKYAGKHIYELNFTNKGGLVMPLIIEWVYKDGSREINRIPAQIWRHNENNVTKMFVKDKEVSMVRLDPLKETADIDESNNTWPNVNAAPTRFELFKLKQANRRNPNQIDNPMKRDVEKKKGF